MDAGTRAGTAPPRLRTRRSECGDAQAPLHRMGLRHRSRELRRADADAGDPKPDDDRAARVHGLARRAPGRGRCEQRLPGRAAALQHLLAGRRCRGRTGVRQLRHAGGLRTAGALRRRRGGQDRHRPLRARLPRRQAPARRRPRRHRLPHLLGPPRRRLLRRRRVSRRPVQERDRRATRLHHGHAIARRRPVDTRLGIRRRGRAARLGRSARDGADTDAADRLW